MKNIYSDDYVKYPRNSLFEMNVLLSGSYASLKNEDEKTNYNGLAINRYPQMFVYIDN